MHGKERPDEYILSIARNSYAGRSKLHVMSSGDPNASFHVGIPDARRLRCRALRAFFRGRVRCEVRFSALVLQPPALSSLEAGNKWTT